MSKTVLVVAAHTDDEALGCGGTLARHVAEGDTVHTIFVADGVSSRPGGDDDALDQRQRAARKAQDILGVHYTTYLEMPDNRLDDLPLLEIVQPLEELIFRIAPETIYTHHFGDLNVDHRKVHEAVMTACRPLPARTVKNILTYEVMSSTEWRSPDQTPFHPNIYVDISNYFEVKKRALEAYELEMRPSPHSRSLNHIFHLAKHRGHCVGIDMAEAFMAVRLIR
ncbi:PIG-L family deacetylase [Endozoicomonas sp. G2_2]|uniref:PIG-L deacetylase family protein n=1 Tax=Endozoicomonas sp. G2_2 TaxID=2821092 RepID=UPI001ADB2552|nr:PIG-L deacetylase family protein [Endozoicomonas sp. G2_2]MBO9469655.1 PIG-L family deacetylase [Endozoicomonas sp. G2_2]